MNQQILRTTVDHLVVLAATLDEGSRWCTRLLGVTPSPGGQHPLMGTHNRLVNISSFAYPDTYLEIIALDPEAQSQRAPGLIAGLFSQSVNRRPARLALGQGIGMPAEPGEEGSTNVTDLPGIGNSAA